MNYIDKFEQIKKRFDNRYFNLLAIVDHINECKWEYQNRYKSNKDKQTFFKELTDLHLLLNVFFQREENQDSIEERIDRFLEKMNG